MPPVKAIAKFVQVKLNMLIIQTMKSAGYESLGIGDNNVDPLQKVALVPSGNDCFVGEPQTGQSPIYVESVGTDDASGSDTGFDKRFHTAGVKPLDGLYLGKTRLVVARKCNRHERLHTPCASPSPSRIGPPHVRVIHFHGAVQHVQCIPVSHGVSDLVHHQPSPIVRNIQFLAELERRVTAFVFGNQKNSPEPIMKRGARSMEHRPGRCRHLHPTSFALPQASGMNGSSFGRATSRTRKSFREACLYQVIVAFALTWKSRLKVQKPHRRVRYPSFFGHYRNPFPNSSLFYRCFYDE